VFGRAYGCKDQPFTATIEPSCQTQAFPRWAEIRRSITDLSFDYPAPRPDITQLNASGNQLVEDVCRGQSCHPSGTHRGSSLCGCRARTRVRPGRFRRSFRLRRSHTAGIFRTVFRRPGSAGPRRHPAEPSFPLGPAVPRRPAIPHLAPEPGLHWHVGNRAGSAVHRTDCRAACRLRTKPMGADWLTRCRFAGLLVTGAVWNAGLLP
jgi:hypothetical protein